MIQSYENYHENVLFVSGSTHPELAQGISDNLGLPLGEVQLETHANTELYVRYLESVRGKDIYIFQPHAAVNGKSINDSFQEQLELIDAAKRASANHITAVTTHLIGSRQDRKAKGRESISVAKNIQIFETLGTQRMVAVDLHSPQSSSLFNGPFDLLTAQPLLREAMLADLGENSGAIVVAADAGHSKAAAYHGRELGLDVVHLNKGRDETDRTVVTHNTDFDRVDGKICLIFDDMIDTAGTLTSACNALSDAGAREIIVAATHGFFSNQAIERIRDSPIKSIYITDSIPVDHAIEGLGNQLKVVSIAPMIARALFEIISNGSVSKLFNDQNNR